MAIINRGKNTFKIAIYIGKDPSTGKKRYKHSTYHGTKRDAQKHERRLKAEFDQSGFLDDQKLTLKEFLNMWLKRIESELSPSTYRRYEQLCRVNIIPILGSVSMFV